MVVEIYIYARVSYRVHGLVTRTATRLCIMRGIYNSFLKVIPVLTRLIPFYLFQVQMQNGEIQKLLRKIDRLKADGSTHTTTNIVPTDKKIQEVLLQLYHLNGLLLSYQKIIKSLK